MKKNILEKLLFINEAFYYLIYTLTFAVAIVESFKYRGFFQKHFHFDFFLLVAITIISGLLTLFFSLSNKILKKAREFYFNGQLFLIPFLFAFLIFLELLNALNYPNYVYSKAHIIPDNLLAVLFLSIFMVVLEGLHNVLKNSKKNLIKVLFLAFILLIILSQIKGTFSYIVGQSGIIIKHPAASYSQKMGYQWGGPTIAYVELIKKITPLHSTILIPPRDDPWAVEGNDHLMRGFLYPRKVISYQKGMDLKKNKIDYVFISWGFWRGSLPESKSVVFPGFNLPSKKIYLFDLRYEKVKNVLFGQYDPIDKRLAGQFGLIEL